jgi:flagellar assembly factor FliW
MRARSTPALSLLAGDGNIEITLADAGARYSRRHGDRARPFGLLQVSALALDLQADNAELLFESGLPGFPDAHRFTLIRWGDDDSPFSIIRSHEHGGLEFVVVRPTAFLPDYEPEIDDVTAERLDLERQEDALVLALLTLGDTAADTTVNLLAPIVVNQHTGRAAQATLSDSSYELRTPLVRGEPPS